MAKSLDQKLAFITGGSEGIGLAVAKQMAQAGANVVIISRNAQKLESALKEIKKSAPNPAVKISSLAADVSDDAGIQQKLEALIDQVGVPDYLINCAGFAHPGYITDLETKTYREMMDVNYFGIVNTCRVLIPHFLRAGKKAHIINTSSVAGLLSPPSMGVYNVSKHAVVTMSETLYHDLRMVEPRIGVSVLCPAFVPTGIADSHRNRPAELKNDAAPTPSQHLVQAMIKKAVDSGKISAAEVAQMTYDAIGEERFYIITHPNILPSVSSRMDEIIHQRNPTSPIPKMDKKA